MFCSGNADGLELSALIGQDPCPRAETGPTTSEKTLLHRKDHFATRLCRTSSNHESCF